MSRYGWLCDYTTGQVLRPATRGELARSLVAGYEGAFTLDGRTVYVVGEQQLSPMQGDQATAVTRQREVTR